MNSTIKLSTIIERLEEQGIKYEQYSLQNGYHILVMEKSGRVFGPFRNQDAEGVFWASEAFETKDAFAAFLSGRNEWNFGGDRMWIAPEFPFFNKSREDFFDSYTVQEGVDPGNYKMEKDAYGNLRLETVMKAELYEHTYDSKEVAFKKTIRINENPLRFLKDYDAYMQNVQYAGFEQEVYMKDISPDKPMELEMWNLTQVQPGGEVLVPYTKDYQFVDYYAPVDETIIRDCGGYASVTIGGTVDRKVSFLSANTYGRAAYLNQQRDGSWHLFVRNYYNDPSAGYVNEPWDKPGKKGCSLHVYIDGGEKGGFAEFENSGKTFGGLTGREETIDNINYWFFFGEKEQLVNIAEVLLGISIRR